MGQPASPYRFTLLPSLVGLFCYACSQTPDTRQTSTISASNQAIATAEQASTSTSQQISVSQSTENAATVSPAKTALLEETEQSQKSDPSAYQEGINLASSAYQLSKSAISPDDWGLVASRWQRAVERLQQVKDDDSNYKAAQTKVKEYGHNAEYATGQIKTLKNTAIATIDRKLPAAANAATVPSNRPSPVAAAPKVTSNKMTVPVVRRLHGTPVVQVTFNGTKTYEMILDTGASRTLITRAMADELKVVATERMVAATASEAEVVFDLGKVESMSMGGITLNNPRVTIGDSVRVGLLGNDFLNGYDITIRSRENVVELVRS